MVKGYRMFDFTLLRGKLARRKAASRRERSALSSEPTLTADSLQKYLHLAPVQSRTPESKTLARQIVDAANKARGDAGGDFIAGPEQRAIHFSAEEILAAGKKARGEV